MKLLLFVPSVFLFMTLTMPFKGGNANSNKNEAKQEVCENEISIEDFFCDPYLEITYNASTPPGFANTCSNCSGGTCSPGSPCRGVYFVGKANGSSSLPSGWSVQWTTTAGIMCSISNGATLTPTIGFNVCKSTTDGLGNQTVPVTLHVFPSGCSPVEKTINVTYSVL